MDEYKVRPDQWIHSSQINRVEPKPRAQPKVYEEVSKAVGKKIYVNDPRLMREVLKWREGANPNKMDRHLDDPTKVAALKHIFRGD